MVAVPSFSQVYLCIQQPYNLHQNSFPLPQSTFNLLSHPYFWIKSSLKSTLTLPSSIPQHFFTFFSFLCTTAPKIFFLPQSLSQFSLHQRTKELWTLTRICNLSIFLKVWTVITTLTITGFLSLRLRKWLYCT